MPIFNHFDLLAPIYDLVFPPPEDSKLFDLIKAPLQSRLLDAGGGTGRVAQRLVAFGHDVIVLDSSLEMLNQTKDKAGIQAVCSETECIPFPDESFTRVVMVDALHHVANQPRTLAELWRVLAPGGTLVVEEPDIRNIAVKFIALVEKLLLMRSHFIRPMAIAAILADLGAQTRVEIDGAIAWVVAEKEAGSS